MTRRLLNVLTGLSLLLCIAALAMWVRSYRVRERFERSQWRILEWNGGNTTNQRHFVVETGRGWVHLCAFNNLTRRPRTPGFRARGLH